MCCGPGDCRSNGVPADHAEGPARKGAVAITTLDQVSSNSKQEPSPEAKAAEELARAVGEQGLSPKARMGYWSS